jgi:hypothetical protein
MGPIKKPRDVASEHTRRESQAKAAAAQAEAEQAQAEQAAAEAKMAHEQAAAIASALQKDETQRQADLHEVAEEEAEAMPPVPWERPEHS